MSILLNSDFGYSSKETLLMGLPTGAVELVGCPLFGILAVYAANKKIPFWKYKLSWAIFAAVLALIASCMLGFATNSKSKTGWCLPVVHLARLIYLRTFQYQCEFLGI